MWIQCVGRAIQSALQYSNHKQLFTGTFPHKKDENLCYVGAVVA